MASWLSSLPSLKKSAAGIMAAEKRSSFTDSIASMISARSMAASTASACTRRRTR